MNDTGGIIDKSKVSYDSHESTDGSGSIRVDSRTSWVLSLYQTYDIDIHGTTLRYEADIKTEDLNGTVYLELICTFDDGEQRREWGLSDPMTGTRNWHKQFVEMRLGLGENPTNIQLNVYVDALGTFWIDNVKLSN